MGERSDQIEQQINRTRGDLNQNLRELGERARDIFDWRYQFENRPGTMLALAFGGGVVASALIPLRSKRSTNHERVRVNDRRSGRTDDEETASTARNAGRRMAAKANAYAHRARKSSPGMGALKGALVSLVASRLSGMIGDLIAGYREELQRTRHDHKDF
jgi:hypothetical protein